MVKRVLHKVDGFNGLLKVLNETIVIKFRLENMTLNLTGSCVFSSTIDLLDKHKHAFQIVVKRHEE